MSVGDHGSPGFNSDQHGIAVVNQEPHPFFIYRNHTRVYREGSTPDSLSMVPVHPHGGEVLRGGSAGWVEWISAVPGGSFTFTATLTNQTAGSLTTDVWIVADVPGLGVFGPVLRYDDIPLSPSQALTVPGITQEIPARAPAGTYRYIAQWGPYPYALGTDSFEFTVSGE